MTFAQWLRARALNISGLSPTRRLELHREWLRATDGAAPSFFTADEEAEPAVFVRAAEGDGGDAPKLATFTIDLYGGGLMDVGFGELVALDLAGMKVTAKARPALLEHNVNDRVGHVTEARATNGRLSVSGIVSGVGTAAQEVVGSGLNKFPWQGSVGARVTRMTFIEKGASVQVNGRTLKGPFYLANAWSLAEASFVSLGADDSTSARIAASQGGGMKFAEWLASKGIKDFDALTAEVQASIKRDYEADIKASDGANDGGGDTPPKSKDDTGDGKAPTPVTAAAKGGDVPDIQEERRQRAEAMRLEGIVRAQLMPHDSELAAKAVAEGWSEDRIKDAVKLAKLEASRPKGPNFNLGADSGVNGDLIIEAGLCMADPRLHGELKNMYDAKTLNAAQERYGRQPLSLQQVILEAAWAGGFDQRHFPKSAGGLKSLLRAAFSTNSISGILSNVGNKRLKASFDAVESTWREIAAIGSVTDFKEQTYYRLTGDMKFQKVGPGGELKHASAGEASYGNQAETHGILFGITRTDLINDDLGALTRTTARIGRGAALQLNDIVWTEFMDNASFFNETAYGNFADGAATALSLDALTAAEVLFMNLEDEDGNPMGYDPAILLVPPALKKLAEQIYASTNVENPSASVEVGNNNVHAGKFKPVCSRYLSNANISGNSAKKWYLLANPADLETIEVVFLNGQQSPIVEDAEASFETLGIQFRGYMDVGARKQEPRAGVAMKGES